MDLTRIADKYHGFQGETPTNFKGQASCRSGKKYEEIYSGAFLEQHASNHLFLMALHQREGRRGHGADHPRCHWGDVELKNIFLSRLVRVSVASWQPEILVERVLTPSNTVASTSSSSSLFA